MVTGRNWVEHRSGRPLRRIVYAVVMRSCLRGEQSHEAESERVARFAQLFQTNIRTQTLLPMNETRGEGLGVKMKYADDIVDAKTRDVSTEATTFTAASLKASIAFISCCHRSVRQISYLVSQPTFGVSYPKCYSLKPVKKEWPAV